MAPCKLKSHEDELTPVYAHNTINHKIACGKSLYNWMAKQGEWTGQNPFEHHEWKAEKVGTYIKSTISPEEWMLIKRLAESQPILLQAITLGYYTGLRPTEIYRIGPESFDHENLILTVKVKKTGSYERLIAIPQCLSTWAINWEWKDANEKNIQNRIGGS